MILAGDIGGTNSRLAFFDASNGRLKLVHEAVYPSRDYSGLEQIVSSFVRQDSGKLDAACFGVAGPVREGRAQISNLPWAVETASLSTELNVRATFLINDLEAMAWGVAALQGSDGVILNSGATNASGNRAVIAAGTGLGQAGMYWDGREHQIFACEGGHADYVHRERFGRRPERDADLQLDCLRRHDLQRPGHKHHHR